MDAFVMKKPCSSKYSSISTALEESHEAVTNTKKMKEKFVEDSQLKPHELSVTGARLDLKVHNDYNNNKNVSCLNPKLMKEKIVEGYQWKKDELSIAEELLDLKTIIVTTKILLIQILDSIFSI